MYSKSIHRAHRHKTHRTHATGGTTTLATTQQVKKRLLAFTITPLSPQTPAVRHFLWQRYHFPHHHYLFPPLKAPAEKVSPKPKLHNSCCTWQISACLAKCQKSFSSSPRRYLLFTPSRPLEVPRSFRITLQRLSPWVPPHHSLLA